LDADAGENGHVIYALEPDTSRSTSLFRVDPGTGSVRLAGELLPASDVTNATYHVTVIARDAGRPLRSAALRLSVMVRSTSEQAVSPVSTHTHTHTHTRPFSGPLSGTTLVSRCTRKVKPMWMSLKHETVSGSGISWATCKLAPRSRQVYHTSTPHCPDFYRPYALLAAQLTASKH